MTAQRLPAEGQPDDSGEQAARPVTEHEWSRAVTAITGADEVCLACHVHPDGDALGSMLAVAHALQGRVVASFDGQPFGVPRILRFLPGTGLLSPPGEFPAQPQVMVTFDAASPDRLGILQANAARAQELIILDHHASNTSFGTVNLVDPAAAATAVVAADLIDRLGVPLTRDIALGLYAGLVTDTGSFRFAATSPQVHLLAARLLQTGIDPAAVAHELWDRSPFGFLGLLSAALGRARLEPDGAAGRGLVWTTVTRRDRAAHGLALEAAESVIDTVRRTDEADVAMVLKEDDDGQWHVSARSKGLTDVGSACTALGGGGHRLAAGFTATGTAADVMAAVRRQFEAADGGQ